MSARSKVRLEMSEEEAARALRYLGDCCTDAVLADVYYRLQGLLKRRDPKRLWEIPDTDGGPGLPGESMGDE